MSKHFIVFKPNAYPLQKRE